MVDGARLASCSDFSMLWNTSSDRGVMKKKTVISSLAIAGLLFGGIVSAPAANASKGCVTQQEFAKVKPGMSQARVAKIFGTKGKVMTQSSGFGTTIAIRDYKTCTQFAAVSILFENGKVQTKTGIF